MRKIILEGTDAVGKSTIAGLLLVDGVEVMDRSRDVISKYMLFDIPMEERIKRYTEFLSENDVLVIFMVNNDSRELMRRVYSRERVSEYDKMAAEYNSLYLETYRAMEEKGLLFNKLFLADCTGLDVKDTLSLIKKIIGSSDFYG